MQEQEKMGIRVLKKWISTLDSRTRDSHQALDGQIAEVDRLFNSPLGEILFPGDPDANPANVYNCRCCLGYKYPGFLTTNNTRRDNETDEVIEYQTYREWREGRPTKWDRAPDRGEREPGALGTGSCEKLVYKWRNR
jgi:uncharacterized protein with gpF-like domain